MYDGDAGEMDTDPAKDGSSDAPGGAAAPPDAAGEGAGVVEGEEEAAAHDDLPGERVGGDGGGANVAPPGTQPPAGEAPTSVVQRVLRVVRPRRKKKKNQLGWSGGPGASHGQDKSNSN